MNFWGVGPTCFWNKEKRRGQREAPPKSVSLFASQEATAFPNFPQVSHFSGGLGLVHPTELRRCRSSSRVCLLVTAGHTMTLGKNGAAEFTKFDASLANTGYYVGKDERYTEYNAGAAFVDPHAANLALDPDAGLINVGSRSNHDNLENNPGKPRSKAITHEALPGFPNGYPQGYSQALLDKGARKPTSPITTDVARKNFIHNFGQPVSPVSPENNPFSSRLFAARPGTAGRPGSPKKYECDGDSIFPSRA